MADIVENVEEVGTSSLSLQFSKLDLVKDGTKYLKRLKSIQGEYKDIFVLEGEISPIKCGYVSDGMKLCLNPYKGPLLIEKESVPRHSQYIIDKIFFDFDVGKYGLILTEKL